MEISRKITLGSINGLRGGFAAPKEKTFAGRIFGIVNSVSVEDSQYGQYNKFVGEFRAVNQDGVESAAPVMMLPEPASTMLADACADSKSVKFGFDFYLQPDEKSKTGYTYATEPLFETKPSDLLAEMTQGLTPPKLPAPKQPALPGTEKAADEKATTKKK